MGKKESVDNSQAFNIFKNFGFLTLGRVLGDFFTFIFYAFLSRYFGQEGFGQYSFAIAFTSFFIVFSDFGIYYLTIKDISRSTRSFSSYYGGMLAVRLLLSAVVLSCLFLLVGVIPYSSQLKEVILLVGSYQILMTLMNGFGAVFIARESMHLASGLEAALKITTSLVSIGVILAGGGLVSALLVLPLATGLYVWVGYFLITKSYGPLKMAISIPLFLTSLREALPFALQHFLFLLTTRMDVVFIGFFLGTAAAGLYNAAYRVVFVLMLLSSFVDLTLFPVVSKLYSNSDENLAALYRKSIGVMVLIGLPASAGLWLTAPSLLVLIFGKAFASSAPILRLLSWLVVVGLCKGMMKTFLAACDRQVEVTKRQAWGAAAGFLGNLILIPAMGMVGAAWATLLSETVLLLLYMQQLKSFLGWPRIFSRVLMSGTATLAFMIPLSWWVPLSLGETIPVAALIYGCILLLFKEIRLNEFNTLLSVLREGAVKWH